MLIAAPIVSELQIPKLVVPNDKTAVTINLFNTLESAAELEVEMQAPPPLFLENSAQKFSRKLTLQPQERWSQTLPLQANFADAAAKLTLKVSGKSEQEVIEISREWTLPIRPITTNTLFRNTAQIKEYSEYSPQVAAPKLLNETRLLTLATAPIIDAKKSLQNLLRYPYGCTEQIVSGAMPWLLTANQTAVANLPLLTELFTLQNKELQKSKVKNSKEILRQALDKLRNVQNASGGFSVWRGAPESQWLTAYVFDFLSQTKAVYPDLVTDNFYQSITKRLAYYLSKYKYPKQNQQLATNSYIAYLLKPSVAELDRIKGKNKQMPTVLAQAQLAAAYAYAGDLREAEALFLALKFGVEKFAAQRSDFTDYGSKLRDLAAASSILFELENSGLSANSWLISDLLEKLNQEMNQRKWLSTQENQALIKAALVSETMRSQPFEFELNGKLQKAQGKAVFEFDGGTQIKTTEKPLYASASIAGYPLEINDLSTVGYTTAERDFYYLSGKKWRGEPVAMGEKLLVVVNLQTENLPEPMIIERIPAGFVGLNPVQHSDLQISKIPNHKDIILKQWRGEYEQYFDDRYVVSSSSMLPKNTQIAYFIQAQVAGKFLLPPIFVESMFSPEMRISKPAALEKFVPPKIQPELFKHVEILPLTAVFN